MMPSLMIDHLSINLRSGTDNLVSEISFAIKEGESLILLGQSGSGKTMTCSAVLNLLDPKKFKVSGSIFFGETDLLNSSEKQRRGIYGNQIVYAPAPAEYRTHSQSTPSRFRPGHSGTGRTAYSFRWQSLSA